MGNEIKIQSLHSRHHKKKTRMPQGVGPPQQESLMMYCRAKHIRKNYNMLLQRTSPFPNQLESFHMSHVQCTIRIHFLILNKKHSVSGFFWKCFFKNNLFYINFIEQNYQIFLIKLTSFLKSHLLDRDAYGSEPFQTICTSALEPKMFLMKVSYIKYGVYSICMTSIFPVLHTFFT